MLTYIKHNQKWWGTKNICHCCIWKMRSSMQNGFGRLSAHPSLACLTHFATPSGMVASSPISACQTKPTHAKRLVALLDGGEQSNSERNKATSANSATKSPPVENYSFPSYLLLIKQLVAAVWRRRTAQLSPHLSGEIAPENHSFPSYLLYETIGCAAWRRRTAQLSPHLSGEIC